MKKINVKNDACIGCGACVAIDSEHFAFNDEGLSHPISQMLSILVQLVL